jgi:hypothetical protein
MQCGHISRHAESIVTGAPDKAAKIIEALKGPWASATIIIPPNGALYTAEVVAERKAVRAWLRSIRD